MSFSPGDKMIELLKLKSDLKRIRPGLVWHISWRHLNTLALNCSSPLISMTCLAFSKIFVALAATFSGVDLSFSKTKEKKHSLYLEYCSIE